MGTMTKILVLAACVTAVSASDHGFRRRLPSKPATHYGKRLREMARVKSGESADSLHSHNTVLSNQGDPGFEECKGCGKFFDELENNCCFKCMEIFAGGQCPALKEDRTRCLEKLEKQDGYAGSGVCTSCGRY